jgi:hypothetical protein
VQPNIQRLLPFLLLIFVVLFIVPTILHRHSSKGFTAGDLSNATIGAMATVDKTELLYKAAHHGYTSQVSDLITLDRALAKALGEGVAVSLDASTSGETYYAQVQSSVLGLFRSRVGSKVILKSCIVIKSGSGVACPAGYTSPGVTTTTSTATTTTTTTPTTSPATTSS